MTPSPSPVAAVLAEPVTHDPCCSAHGVPMTCTRYRRTHFVEVRPCCAHDRTALAAVDVAEATE